MINLFEAWYRIGFQISGLIFKSCFFIFLQKKDKKECRFLKYVKSTNKTEKLLKKKKHRNIDTKESLLQSIYVFL